MIGPQSPFPSCDEYADLSTSPSSLAIKEEPVPTKFDETSYHSPSRLKKQKELAVLEACWTLTSSPEQLKAMPPGSSLHKPQHPFATLLKHA